jgi:hypothetical protein
MRALIQLMMSSYEIMTIELMRAKNSFEASDNFNNARIKPFDESTN